MRASKSPRDDAPATRSATLSCTSRLPASAASLFCAMRHAKPSTMAVLPTPASPKRSGLLFVSRLRARIICSNSSRRPMHGEILPSRASCVRSLPKCCRKLAAAGCCGEGEAAIHLRITFFRASAPGVFSANAAAIADDGVSMRASSRWSEVTTGISAASLTARSKISLLAGDRLIFFRPFSVCLPSPNCLRISR